jgi:cytochrome c-type biogenesis protein
VGFDITYLGAMGAGLLSFVSPCILPIVPPYLCFLAGVSLETLTDKGDPAPGARRRIVLAALAFALGFGTVFVAMGATASTIGQTISQYFDVLRWIAGGVILVLGLHFLGIIRIPILYRQAQIQVERSPATLLGAYLVGLAFAFGWTPCVGPVLAAILFTAGAQETAWEGAALLGAYAVGIGIPFVAAAAFAGPFMTLMRRFRRHMGTVERVMGGALVVTGLLFITNSVSVIGGWMQTYVPAMG